MNGRCNLRRTAGLGTVTDNAPHIAQGVADGTADLLIIAAAEIGNAGTCTAGGTNRSAEGGKSTDVVLDVNGHQIADNQGSVHLLFGNGKSFRIFHHRHTYGNTLISGAGVNHHRKGTAAHSGIRSCCRSGACTSPYIGAPGLQNRLSHTGPPGIVQALLGNRQVHLHLSL